MSSLRNEESDYQLQGEVTVALKQKIYYELVVNLLYVRRIEHRLFRALSRMSQAGSFLKHSHLEESHNNLGVSTFEKDSLQNTTQMTTFANKL